MGISNIFPQITRKTRIYLPRQRNQREHFKYLAETLIFAAQIEWVVNIKYSLFNIK